MWAAVKAPRVRPPVVAPRARRSATTCVRGLKGGQLPLYMRLPKLRGFKNPFKVEFQVINIARLVELFPEGGEVAVADLIAKGAVRDNAPVKVLGDGETTVAFTLKGVKVSASAKSKIEAAGGSVSED